MPSSDDRESNNLMNGTNHAEKICVRRNPKSIMILNVEDNFFTHRNKQSLESFFNHVDRNCRVIYLPSFSRIRVDFKTRNTAERGRSEFSKQYIPGTGMKVIWFHNILANRESQKSLQPPKREKQFLISPPASPPIDWEPVTEHDPVVNYDLLSKLAELEPGEAHELHPSAGANHPAICVFPSEDVSSATDGDEEMNSECSSINGDSPIQTGSFVIRQLPRTMRPQFSRSRSE